MQKVYFIPGLGADHRSFQFLDLSFCAPQFVAWIEPQPRETLGSYAERLFKQIDDPDATIVGVSFGGMLATEMAKKHRGTRVVIISSAKTYQEIPGYLRIWQHLPVYRLLSDRLKNYSGSLALRLLGARGAAQKKVQRKILFDSDAAFTRWAMDAIVRWSNTEIPKNVVHIHGTADRLLPFRFVTADHTVLGGEHVMLMDKALEVSQLLKAIILS